MTSQDVFNSLKPTWRNLKSSGSWGTPVSEFLGTFVAYGTEAGNFGVQVSLKFEKVQVIASDAPYVRSDLGLLIKFSEQENSGWGRLGKSIATKLGVTLDNLDLDMLKNQTWHMVRRDNQDFGFTDKEGRRATGTVWELLELVQPGQAAVFSHSVAMPTVAMPTVAMAAPVVGSDQDPDALALSMLDGKSLQQFYQAVLPSEVLKLPANLPTMRGILSGIFIASHIAAGDITETGGIYTVVKK